MGVTIPEGPIEAGAFTLRAWRPQDAAWYLSALDGEIFTWTTELPGLTVGEIAAVIRQNNAQPLWIALAICRADGALVGNISLTPDPAGAWAEAAYWVAAEGRGRGAATAALSALVGWAFDNTGIQGVFLGIAPGNARSIAVAKRCGFKETGRYPERLRFELMRG